uniref:Ovochymase 2 (gene/pseudogene) n=1 Tax=Loxodonta africana TaxID=9785 RepID=G3SRM6_LOXAF
MFSNVSGGEDVYGEMYIRQVSLKLSKHHFCGGSLIQDDLVITAAHCLVSLNDFVMQIKNLTVTTEEYGLFQKNKQEQNIPASNIVSHLEYNRFGYMNSDITLLYLKHRVKFGISVQSICLPGSDDKFEVEFMCPGSWSSTSEYSSVLQEVELPILDDRIFNPGLKDMNPPPLGGTMVCAVFPDGGKDARQGDFGGPLVCRRDDGTGTVAGITSWGTGFARGEDPLRNNQRRASTGLFSKIRKMWVCRGFGVGPTPPDMNPRCVTKDLISVQNVDGSHREEGMYSFPHKRHVFYYHLYLCIWKIMVSEDKIILIKFTSLDRKSSFHRPVLGMLQAAYLPRGKVCGDMLPPPLLTDTNEIAVTLVSDTESGGSAFELTFTAKNSEAGISDSGCGRVAVLVEEGIIHSASYPDLYPRNVTCHWFIHAPEKHIIKLAFEEFTIGFNQNSTHDAVVIYGDPEEEHELAKLCGVLNPTPICSPSNMTVIRFKSDGENDFQGFRQRFTFLPSGALKIGLRTLYQDVTVILR